MGEAGAFNPILFARFSLKSFKLLTHGYVKKSFASKEFQQMPHLPFYLTELIAQFARYDDKLFLFDSTWTMFWNCGVSQLLGQRANKNPGKPGKLVGKPVW